LLNSGNILTAAAIVGHAGVTTTAKYDQRGDRAKQAAASLLHVPYSRRKENKNLNYQVRWN
jgi:hypothetical protein